MVCVCQSTQTTVFQHTCTLLVYTGLPQPAIHVLSDHFLPRKAMPTQCTMHNESGGGVAHDQSLYCPTVLRLASAGPGTVYVCTCVHAHTLHMCSLHTPTECSVSNLSLLAGWALALH